MQPRKIITTLLPLLKSYHVINARLLPSDASWNLFVHMDFGHLQSPPKPRFTTVHHVSPLPALVLSDLEPPYVRDLVR